MKLRISAIFTLLLLPFLANGQIDRYTSGYYMTDSATYTSGAQLYTGVPELHSRFCIVKIGKRIMEYTPHEIIEYGYKNGAVYISREIELDGKSERVFLERLSHGNLNLYQFKERKTKSYFLEKADMSLVEIHENKGDQNNNFKDLLSMHTSDFQDVHMALKHVNYNKNSMAEYVTRYNTCDTYPFPRFRFGATVGYQMTREKTISARELDGVEMDKSFYLHPFDILFQFENHLAVGAFMNIPLASSNFSLHSELNFTQMEYNYTTQIIISMADLIVKNSTLELPCMVRYTIPLKMIRPFINGGAMFAYHVLNQNLIYNTWTSLSDQVENEVLYKSELIADLAGGFAAGTGIEIPVTEKHALFFEFRYLRHLGLSKSNHLDRSGFQFSSGINF